MSSACLSLALQIGRDWVNRDSFRDGMRPLPRPMLLRPGGIPTSDGWAFELKYDDFRAIVSTEGDLRVRSRRGGT